MGVPPHGIAQMMLGGGAEGPGGGAAEGGAGGAAVGAAEGPPRSRRGRGMRRKINILNLAAFVIYFYFLEVFWVVSRG